MAGVAVTLVSNTYGGGSGGDGFQDLTTYTDAAAAVAAVSNGLLVFDAPQDLGASAPDSKSRAVAVSQIKEIRSL